jgi:cytochrome c biogenesis protein CcmG/thiol:disulfide interchange protein DsbE
VVNAEGEITYRFAGPITVEIMDKYIKPEIAKAAE